MNTPSQSKTSPLAASSSERSVVVPNAASDSIRPLTQWLLAIVARCDRFGIAVTRLGIIIVLFWIGGLKAFDYEAESIVPFVANSPLMSFLLAHPGAYAAYKNAEGTLVPANHGKAMT